jgi:hypothetical protein
MLAAEIRRSQPRREVVEPADLLDGERPVGGDAFSAHNLVSEQLELRLLRHRCLLPSSRSGQPKPKGRYSRRFPRAVSALPGR